MIENEDQTFHPPANEDEELRAKALVASGDYFETLAAQLEQIAAIVPAGSPELHLLQDAVGQLLYLQKEYMIVPRPPGPSRPHTW